MNKKHTLWLVVALVWLAGPTPRATVAAARDPVVYSIQASASDTHIAEIEARFPTDGRASMELMMPVWSPGYYVVEDYATRVQDLAARTPDGAVLPIEKTTKNRWRVTTNGATTVVVTYRLLCQGRSVTGSWIGADYAVLNGPSTYITLVEQTQRPHEVHLVMSAGWKQSATSLDPAPDGQPNHYRGSDYDVFADSPIVAGTLSIHSFDLAGATYSLVDFGGDVGQWDGEAAAQTLKRIVDEHRKMLGGLPLKRYVFLNAFRGGAGGLEHQNSTLLSSSAAQSPTPTLRWLKYVSHEFFHAINVKRLRPIELGPFDYDHAPSTPSLWISEGVTTYYGDLAVERSGVGPPEDFLAGMSSLIRSIQTRPGRLVQTLERASLDVTAAGGSGIGGNRNTTVSYYDKGTIVGFLLDARIRHVTNDAKSFDDVMRLAYKRYGGARGFKPEEFQATASDVAGVDLTAFFRKTTASTDELEYTELLDWFGLRFATPEPPDPATTWTLQVRPDATDAQKRHLQRLMASAGGR